MEAAHAGILCRARCLHQPAIRSHARRYFTSMSFPFDVKSE
jgi:hypothetical protein